MALSSLKDKGSRPSKPKAEAGRKVARTDPALKEAGQPVALSPERTTPVYRGRRYETGSAKDLSHDLREQASSSSSAPRGRAKAVEPSSRSFWRPLQAPPRLQPSARYCLGPDPRPGHRAVPARRYRASLLLSRAYAKRRRRPSQWMTMTRVAALLRAPPGRPCTRLAHGSVTKNGPASEDCSTFDPDGRVCPGHRGSSRGSPPIDPATMPVDADVAARREKRRADKVAFRKEQAMAVSETHTCGEWNLSFRNKCWKCSSKKGQAVRSGPRSRARCWCHRCVDGATERRSWP